MPQAQHSTNLVEETRTLLTTHYPALSVADRRHFARDLKVTRVALENFINGDTTAPRADLIQRMYEKLTGNRLLTYAA